MRHRALAAAVAVVAAALVAAVAVPSVVVAAAALVARASSPEIGSLKAAGPALASLSDVIRGLERNADLPERHAVECRKSGKPDLRHLLCAHFFGRC